jgi:hypothetical protein
MLVSSRASGQINWILALKFAIGPPLGPPSAELVVLGSYGISSGSV